MNPLWIVRTARLVLTPVSGADLADLRAIKADPRVFAVMLGGVRTPVQSMDELAEDVIAWGANGFGMWAIREHDGPSPGFVGLTGLERRPDGLGVALRFALWPEAQGRGLAREAAGAALRFGHQQAGLRRIVAVARESNFASRTVLGGIGMTECGCFVQQGHRVVMFESIAEDAPSATEEEL
jgi:RimJ/RimL family protein N-acetyltransferase